MLQVVITNHTSKKWMSHCAIRYFSSKALKVLELSHSAINMVGKYVFSKEESDSQTGIWVSKFSSDFVLCIVIA